MTPSAHYHHRRPVLTPDTRKQVHQVAPANLILCRLGVLARAEAVVEERQPSLTPAKLALYLSRVEVVILVEIGQQAGLHRTPTQAFPSLPARGWIVESRGKGEPAKVARRFLRRLSDDRQPEPLAYDFSDLPEGNSFFCSSVVLGACHAFLQGKPEKSGGVGPVYGGPTVAASTDIGGRAPFREPR